MYLCRGFRQDTMSACFCLNMLVELLLVLDNIAIGFPAQRSALPGR
ncbi:hypothetical protein K875_04308 [Mycobacterium [tuberculosis] TKK-01-0051]|uniref:Uncharacterized protein n=1 Tax=Mycobacterium [tuberculosis] TKK-01-0051 TaxID=1324261 RepID=A0A051TWP7_9MYCO|nr:hypothetical protein K875_04308 [Mycobacterium [tuberculosis] TKK-01-0051]